MPITFSGALSYASKDLFGLAGANQEQTRGVVDVIRRTLQPPRRQIAESTGLDGAVVAGTVMDQNRQSFGFNAQTDAYEDLVAAGVTDPTRVDRSSLQDAASVAGLITAEATVAECGRMSPPTEGRLE